MPEDVRNAQAGIRTANDTKTVAQAVLDGPGRVASFTDVNDITVLLRGRNVDGTRAVSSDYAFAGVGLFLPISGGSIRNGLGQGLDVLEGIPKKMDNISGHLTDMDVTGAIRDILGDPVIINGKQFDHKKEVTEALQGLGNQLDKLGKAISSGTFSGSLKGSGTTKIECSETKG